MVDDNGIMMEQSNKGPCLTIDSMNPHMRKLEYAVRGPLVIRATQIEKELQNQDDESCECYPFKDVIKANIGDAQAMGNPTLSFLRQVLALITYPPLLESAEFPQDVKSRALIILNSCKGRSVGSYSDSTGIEVIREHVAKYISKRDGGVDSNITNIILCNGASDGIRAVLKMFSSSKISGDEGKPPAVMIPIPQYPLYSATLSEFNINQVGYYLNEDENWSLEITELERAVLEARKNSNPRAIVVINPGNPTGQVLTKKNIEEVIKFAYSQNLFILADEVYQHNIYASESTFHSFKKVMFCMGSPYNKMALASFMSCSKGFFGECGLRGGYTEICNLDPLVKGVLLKCISAKLCPSVIGQACIDVVVNPPVKGDASFGEFISQKDFILNSLAEKARLVVETLNNFEAISCNQVQGAMYAFPRIHLSTKAIDAASSLGVAPDYFYAAQLLEKTGICIVPGSGFGQMPGTFHFRTTILPKKDKLLEMLRRMKIFHDEFIREYQD